MAAHLCDLKELEEVGVRVVLHVLECHVCEREVLEVALDRVDVGRCDHAVEVEPRDRAHVELPSALAERKVARWQPDLAL